jgi:integrase
MNKRTNKPEWYGKVTYQGRVLTKLAKSKKDALRWESATRKELEAETRTGTASLSTLFNQYLDNVQARFSASSYKDKARVYREALARFGDVSTDRVKYRDIEIWLNEVKKRVSGITANRYKVHMVAAYNWGIKALHLPEPNPWRIQKYKEEVGAKYVPSVEDFWKCYDSATDEERDMLLVFLHLAGRKREVFNLTWEDVDFGNNKIRLWTRKRDGGREWDLLPMSPDIRSALSTQRFRTGLGEYVFPNPETGQPYTWHGKFLPRLCKMAGVREFGYHSLRHLAACLLDESGEPLAYIQAMLRHKNAVTTSRYLHSLRGIRPPEKGAFTKKGAQEVRR